MRRPSIKKVIVLASIPVLAVALFIHKNLLVSAAAVPSVSFQNVQSSPFVGESLSFTVRFDNSGDAVGYGPYVDLIIPEHIAVTSMTHLGSSLSYTNAGVFPVGDPSCITHPFARDVSGSLKQICLTPNPGTDVKLYTVQLPFGSFVDTQTAADIVVTASLDGTAPIGVAKTIQALGGFYLGADALDNPTTDPSFDSGYSTTTVTPSVIRLTKSYVADYLNGGGENEIAPGPNNSQIFRIQADIANGATISNLVLSDTLDAHFTNLTIDAASPAVTSSNITGQVVSATWASVTGGGGSNDA